MSKFARAKRSGTGRRKFVVTYARTVIMRVTVEAKSVKEVEDKGLPGVYDGQAKVGQAPKHVVEVRDDEFTWDVEEAEGKGGKR